MSKYRFFLHYNKPLSKQKGEHYWSVHFRGTCHMVKNIKCELPTESKVNKRQPFVVMQGYAKELIMENDKIIIK